jgi:PmbA protein
LTEILAAAESAVKLAMKRGFDEVEVFSTNASRREIIYHNVIEATRSNTIVGLSVRGVVDKRMGFYSVSSLDRPDIENAVEQSLKIAKTNAQDPDWKSLTRKYGKAAVEKVFDRRIETLSAKELVEQVQLAVDTVREVDPSLAITRGILSSSVVSNAIANSHGCRLERKETFASSWIAVTAGSSGKKGVGHEAKQTRSWKSLNNEHLAQTVSERALKMVDASSISNGKFDVVWRNDAFAGILDAMLTRTVTADAIQKHRSPWVGKVGQSIASEQISLTDEGKMPGGLGTRQFDDDGTPQKRTPIIEKGVLRGFLYDVYTASKENRQTTGNAHREGGLFSTRPNYTQAPFPYPNNLVLKPQTAAPEEVIKETGTGVYIVETIGEWLSNPISGDLSATISSAFKIENGELGNAIKGGIVTGNFFDILKGKMDLRANDLDSSGAIYAPTTRVLDMTIAGE